MNRLDKLLSELRRKPPNMTGVFTVTFADGTRADMALHELIAASAEGRSIADFTEQWKDADGLFPAVAAAVTATRTEE